MKRNNIKLILVNLAIIAILVGELVIAVMGAAFAAMVVAITVAIGGMLIFAARPYGEEVIFNVSTLCYATAFIGYCIAETMDASLAPVVGIGLGVFAFTLQIWISISCLQGRI